MTLAAKLKQNIQGDVLFDRFSRGRYSTDASIYQIEPIGVVIPRNQQDLQACIAIAAEEGAPLLPRGGGTSQSGQTVGRALIIDFTKYLNNVLALDAQAQTCRVEPGIVLDELNRKLKPLGLWFPVDVSTSSRATIGGMAGNNSCGTRSIRYGIMRDRVIAIEAILHDGSEAKFGEVQPGAMGMNAPSQAAGLMREMLALGRQNAAVIANTFPAVSRRVGGYNIDALLPNGAPVNLATLLVGSEGTLAISKSVELKLAPLPKNKATGVCHFPTFRGAMEAAQHIVKLQPVAVELVDRTMIDLALGIPLFRQTMQKVLKGEPQALLLTEFAEDDQQENLRRLKRLGELMGDLGLAGSVVEVIDPGLQEDVRQVRQAGLNIMMSMKTEGKPVSFIEDCAVPLEHLADYTGRLTEVFEKYGATGTWYAHASVGCLHVRPILNLKLDLDASKMRAIAEEAFAMVKEYKGAHSGEHGDGLVRSEFHERMYGRDAVQLFEQVKDRFDPKGRMNPGKIVRPPRMNERTLFRYKPDYHVPPMQMALDWSGYPGSGGGFQGAVEMCNNNGECRKLTAGVMCPSYRVTLDERDVTRGRANSLRLAISGQLGPDALGSDDMLETLKLCVSCKGCRRECPTGVDMAKMKIEVLNAANKRRGAPSREKLIAYLPRYAPYASRAGRLLNLRNRIPALAALGEALGFSRRRPLPRWHSEPFQGNGSDGSSGGSASASRRAVVLFADTFNTYFEPGNLRAAREVLEAAGYRVIIPWAASDDRPFCCGRTFLAAGLVDEARAEARRFIAAVKPYAERGVAIIGLEPSCLFTLRDEFLSMLPGEDTRLIAGQSFLLEEFLAREMNGGNAALAFRPLEKRALVHGHCHQKAFAAIGATMEILGRIPGLKAELIESSCCGMAGAFGYYKETYDISMKMAELSLLPAVRKASPGDLIVAGGFSCRHQIADGAGRQALHPAQVLRDALPVKDV